jgi:HEAT repeat protein
LKLLLAALGGVVLLVAAVHALYYLGGWTWSASPAKLAEQALNKPTVEERTRAAVRLGDCGYEAREELRRVLQQSDTPEVRAACIQAIGAIEDYDSMDLLLEALEDEAIVVRGSAGSAVSKMVMGHDLRFSFKANAPEQERKKAVATLRAYWEQLRGSPLLNRYRRLQERRGNND